MTSSIFSPSPFEIPHIQNAKLVKLKIKRFSHNIVYNYTKIWVYYKKNGILQLYPFHLKRNPILLKHFLLLENI